MFRGARRREPQRYERATAASSSWGSAVTSVLPQGLSVARHGDLAGRSADPWIRRLLLTGLAGIVLLALLGVFGQQPRTSRAASADASLVVRAPSRIRG